MRDGLSNKRIRPLIAPAAAITDNTAIVSSIIDCQGYDSVTLAFITGTNADADALSQPYCHCHSQSKLNSAHQHVHHATTTAAAAEAQARLLALQTQHRPSPHPLHALSHGPARSPGHGYRTVRRRPQKSRR